MVSLEMTELELVEKNPPSNQCQDQQEIMTSNSSKESERSEIFKEIVKSPNMTEIVPICFTENEELKERRNDQQTNKETEKLTMIMGEKSYVEDYPNSGTKRDDNASDQLLTLPIQFHQPEEISIEIEQSKPAQIGELTIKMSYSVQTDSDYQHCV